VMSEGGDAGLWAGCGVWCWMTGKWDVEPGRYTGVNVGRAHKRRVTLGVRI
jgi:hypothetical protein